MISLVIVLLLVIGSLWALRTGRFSAIGAAMAGTAHLEGT